MGNACSLLGFDLGGCLVGLVFWWVPLVPWWGWLIAGLVLVGVVWKFAGWPGLIGLGVVAGFFLGRRSVSNDEIWPPQDPKPQRRRSSQSAPPGKRVRTIFDMFNGRR